MRLHFFCGLITLTFVLLVSCTHQISTQTEPPLQEPQIEFNPRSYICYKTASPIQVDGKLTEAAWQNSSWTEDFGDIEGALKPAPRFKTRAKMCWDAEFLYVGAELEEPHVWARLMQRDTVIFYDNDFEIFIDPDGDTHQYYELEFNAFSTEWDLLLVKPYRDGAPAINAWDVQGMKSAVSVDGTINNPADQDQGWTIEIAMPWKVLKECANKNAPPVLGDLWRINFSRVEWQMEIQNGRYAKKINPATQRPFPEDNWVWSPQGVINMHYPEMWGFLQFSDKIAGEGSELFTPDPAEKAKWALRQVYYRQRNYFQIHQHYAKDIHDLGLNLKVDGYKWPPAIHSTPDLFQATITSQDNQQKWHILQDGRVWRAKKE
jgi:hypothetical protein